VAHRADDGLVIAIDGPSGSGKSTVARAVARGLGYRYLDTGSMYRALTWLVLREGVDPDDESGVSELARTADLHVVTDPVDPGVAVDGVDVAGEIRSSEVTAAVSAVSAHPDVRTCMVARQRALIGAGGIVVEGRDIGTTVAPTAAVKVFLTASADVRAARRTKETAGAAHDDSSVEQTLGALQQRDAADSGRATSPLTQAADATVIDSSDLDIDDVVARVVAAARTAGAA
jgi:cytidylate kinase